MATLSAKELAAQLDTDGRTVRKFLRAVVKAADVPNPGKGQRWSIEAKDVKKLKTHFVRWNAARVEAAAAANAPEADTEDAPTD